MTVRLTRREIEVIIAALGCHEGEMTQDDIDKGLYGEAATLREQLKEIL